MVEFVALVVELDELLAVELDELLAVELDVLDEFDELVVLVPPVEFCKSLEEATVKVGPMPMKIMPLMLLNVKLIETDVLAGVIVGLVEAKIGTGWVVNTV